MNNFNIVAIDRTYAICIDNNDSFGLAAHVAIVPYNVDAGLKYTDSWVDACTLNVGADIELISFAENWVPTAVMMIETGKFVVLCRVADGYEEERTARLYVVTFAAIDDVIVDLVELDLSDVGYTGHAFDPGVMIGGAINFEADECSFLLPLLNESTYESVNLVATFKTSDFTLLNVSVHGSALQGLVQPITENYFSIANVSNYYKRAEGDFDQVSFVGNYTYGAVIEFFRYASRDGAGSLTYIDADANTEISAPSLISARLNALGYTPTDPAYSPLMGVPSLYIS